MPWPHACLIWDDVVAIRSSRRRFRSRAALRFREHFLFPPNGNRVYRRAPTYPADFRPQFPISNNFKFIFAQNHIVDGNNSPSQIARTFSRQLSAHVDESVVLLALNQLASAQLLVEPEVPVDLGMVLALRPDGSDQIRPDAYRAS